MKVIPIHPQPLDDELLTSWMVRLASANHYHLHTFYHKVIGIDDSLWTRDLDRCQPKTLLSTMSDAAGVSSLALIQLTLKSYEGTLFEKLTTNGFCEWLIPLGIFHRTRKALGIQYCPLCLREDPIPYFRKCWRLANITFCNEHHCLLSQGCPKCHSPIAFHRNGIGKHHLVSNYGLERCSECGFDLRKARPVFPRRLMCRELKLFSSINKLVNYYSPGSLQDIALHTFILLQGISILIRALRLDENQSLRNELRERFQLHDFEIKQAKKPFGLLPVHTRFNYLFAVGVLLHDWPDEFRSIARKHSFRASSITRERAVLPFWLQRVVDDGLKQSVYRVTSQQLETMSSFLKRNNIRGRPTQPLGGPRQSERIGNDVYNWWVDIKNRCK